MALLLALLIKSSLVRLSFIDAPSFGFCWNMSDGRSKRNQFFIFNGQLPILIQSIINLMEIDESLCESESRYIENFIQQNYKMLAGFNATKLLNRLVERLNCI